MIGVVITGGPGSGKTSLIDALAQADMRSVPEAGRAIIRDEQGPAARLCLGGIAPCSPAKCWITTSPPTAAASKARG